MSTQKPSAIVLLGLFCFWYATNAGYNVFNAKEKAVFPFPYALALSQLAVGLAYVVPLWATGIRTIPKLRLSDIARLAPIIILNAIGHITAVLAMFQKGGGSFTHVIKASEPVVSVIMGLLFTGVIPKPLTAMSLLPISYGVAYASTLGDLSIETISKELTTKAAMLAMASNVANSLRSILRKNLTEDFKKKTNLDAANDHAVTTFLSLVILALFLFFVESRESLIAGYTAVIDKNSFHFDVIVCGMCFYLYNEMQNIVLSSLGPVPTAVGNTLKRVVIFVALYYFTEGETFPPAKILGCAIAVSGCLLFAVFDSKKM